MALLIMLAATSPAAAQYIDYNAVNVTSNLQVMMRESLASDRGPVRSGAKPRPPAPRVATANAALPYTSTLALRRQTVDGLVGRTARSNPEAARLIATQFAKHDYAQIYRGLTAPAGLRENDAADATAAYTLLGWQIANRDATEVGNAKVAAVRNQMAARLAADPRLSQPATRAALGEELKLLFVTLHAGWQGATREGTTKAYSDGIAAMFKAQSGTDLRAMRLTDNGLGPR